MRLHTIASLYFSIFVFQATRCLAQAQTVQEAIWNIPDGRLSDLSQTFTSGTTLPLSWNGYDSSAYIDASKSLLDLWVSTYDFAQNPFSQLLKENINLTVPGTFAWTIDIPDDDLGASAKYVLRFKEPALAYNQNTPDLSSPGFLVLRANSPSSSAVSSSSVSSSESSSTQSSSTQSTLTSSPTLSTLLPSSSSIISSTFSAPSPSVSPSTDTQCTSCGLSSGAKAGIGIGIAVAVLGVVAAAFLCFRRKRKNKEPSSAPLRSEPATYDFPDQQKPAPPGYAVELPGRGGWGPAELPGR